MTAPITPAPLDAAFACQRHPPSQTVVAWAMVGRAALRAAAPFLPAHMGEYLAILARLPPSSLLPDWCRSYARRAAAFRRGRR